MERVDGVRKTVLIITVGLIAGLVIWFQVAPTAVNVSAFNDDSLIEINQPSQKLILVSSQLESPPIAKAVALADTDPKPSSAEEILTVAQRERLNEASRKYLAETPAEGIRVARSLNIVKDGGDPTNICGPLSIAILRDAGLIEPYTQFREFWLLNPDQNRRLLEQTFPVESFAHYTFATPLNEMDWKLSPLKPGDFLYIYAGPGGTFEHMLAINRVDEAGRAYAVTNYATPEGFIIGEVMLYDPVQPGKGKFYEWTNREHDQFGSTGFGGFELWRLTQPIREKNPREESFARDLDSVMALHGGEWHVAVKKLDGEMVYERQAGVTEDVGSMIKIPVAMLFFKSLEIQGVKPADYSKYLSEEGPGRTYEQLLRAMIIRSEFEATKALLKSARENGLNVDNVLSQWGLKNTHLDSGKSSVNDLVFLYQGLYSGSLINPTAREYILNLMEEGTSNKYTRLGVLQKTNPASLGFYNRRGSTQDSVVAIGDSALVSVPVVDGEDAYILVILGDFSHDLPTTDQELIRAIEEMSQVFWSYARK